METISGLSNIFGLLWGNCYDVSCPWKLKLFFRASMRCLSIIELRMIVCEDLDSNYHISSPPHSALHTFTYFATNDKLLRNLSGQIKNATRPITRVKWEQRSVCPSVCCVNSKLKLSAKDFLKAEASDLAWFAILKLEVSGFIHPDRSMKFWRLYLCNNTLLVIIHELCKCSQLCIDFYPAPVACCKPRSLSGSVRAAGMRSMTQLLYNLEM